MVQNGQGAALEGPSAPDLEAPDTRPVFSGLMPRKPKSENPAPPVSTPAPAPSILDAFKSPAPPSPRATEPVKAAPNLSDEPGERVQKVLSDAAAAMHDPEPPPTEPAPTPPLPRAVEILFDLALEVSERDKTSISTRLDAAAEIMAWLDSLGCARPSYDVPRTGALRVFLEHIAEYRVRCEPKERVRAAALLLKMG